MPPPPLSDYIASIEAAAAALPGNVRLWAEPGRALVAGGGSVVVQVQLRRGDTLFVNNGVYGSLSDAGALGFRFPARRIRLGEVDDAEEAPADFALFGPTCDSADRMRGPFRLPADMREGDWIELGQLGAYGACLRTAFNGFGRVDLVEVADPPMLATQATKRRRRGAQASSQILSVSGRPRMSSRPSGRARATPACSRSEAI
jgi:ornithine decarboxylase